VRPRATTRLRELIARGPTLYVPGCYNAMSAKVLADAGFEAIYMTGYGTSLSLTGYPDVGLTTMGEMVANARYIAEASGLPLIADAGFIAVPSVATELARIEGEWRGYIHHRWLISVAGDGRLLAAQADPDLAAGRAQIAAHLTRFWDPRMRRELVAHVDERAGEGLRPSALEAILAHRATLVGPAAPADRDGAVGGS